MDKLIRNRLIFAERDKSKMVKQIAALFRMSERQISRILRGPPPQSAHGFKLYRKNRPRLLAPGGGNK